MVPGAAGWESTYFRADPFLQVSTDLFGRGIDIERVNIVINYDMPDESNSARQVGVEETQPSCMAAQSHHVSACHAAVCLLD